MTVEAAPARTDAVPAEPEPFEVFFRREYRSLVALAYALSGSRLAAEDIAQEALLAAHRRWDRLASYDRPSAWVRRVAANMATSHVRRRIAEAKALMRLARRDPPRVAELEADADDYWSAVRSLPRRQAQAIALRYLADRSITEIAEIMRCSESTVRVHLHKGRMALAKRLRLEEETP